MKKTITINWLKSKSAYQEGLNWLEENNIVEMEPTKLIKLCMKSNHFDYANWLIVRVMNKRQKVQYAIFAAKQVLSIFEKRYPEDKRPRRAIESAEAYTKNPCKQTKKAAYADAYAANAANAANAAANAANAYADAYADAKKKMQIKIINHGIQILKG